MSVTSRRDRPSGCCRTGWNEIPFTAGDLYSDTDGINNPKYWDALFIWLPAFTCGIDYKKRAYKWDRMKCVDKEGIKFLEAKLDNYVANGALFPGKGYAGNRPGSSVAIARQIPEWDTDISKWDAKTGWTRQFYCENAKLKKHARPSRRTGRVVARGFRRGSSGGNADRP